MNIWLSSEFEKAVRSYYSGRQQRVWELLSSYLRRPETFENDRRNNDYKPLKHSVCGGTRPVMKYQIDDGGRIFLIELDDELAASLTVVGADPQIRPSGGEFVLIGITGKPQHERQGHFGSLFGSRFFSKKKVSLYCPAVKVARSAEKLEDQKDRNARIDFAAGMYAAKIPFENYQDYVDSVENAEVKLSERQYEILNKIVNDNRKRVAILMGCAGSGKTLMAVTSLLCGSSSGAASKKRMYFSLSEKLANSSETVFSKILACKTASSIEWEEGPSNPWYHQFNALRAVAVNASRLHIADLLGRAADQNIPGEEIDRRLRDPQVDFADANSYFIRRLGWDVRNRVLYDRFKKEFFLTHCRDERDLGADDLWTEIRGLIKGYHGAHKGNRAYSWYWGRCEYPQLRDMFHGGIPPQHQLQTVQRCLKELGYVTEPKLGEHGFIWKTVDSVAEQNVLSRCPQQAELVSEMFAAVRRNDYTKTAMTLGEYLQLGSDQSAYGEADRRRIYRLYQKYEQWLTENGFYDENDLAREILRRIDSDDESESIEPMDLDVLVIDECQDLSEMQLLALSSLVGGQTRVIFAGDRHQVINPTYFDPERLYSISSLRNAQGVVDCEKYFVNDNHRSTKEVVGIANVVSDLRRKCVGRYSPEFEQDEHSEISGFYPHFVRYGSRPDVLSLGLERVASDPDVAFIVHDAKDRDRLVSLLPPSLRMSAEGNTFTIKECKGLEFKKVFCFDILGKQEYRWAWDDILSPQGVRHEGKYRYYFNTLYVAITRSQSGICLLECDESERRHRDWFVTPGQFRSGGIEAFDGIVTEFGLKVGTAREWLDHARRFLQAAEDGHERDMFVRALNAFRDAAGKEDSSEEVRAEATEGCWQCDIELAKIDGRNLYAAQQCFEHRCLDRLPKVEMVSDAERPDVQLLVEFAQKGFEGCSPAQTRRLVKMLSGSESGRMWLSDMLEMRMSAVAYSVAQAAELKSA